MQVDDNEIEVQRRGLCNRPLVLKRNRNAQTQKWDYILSEQDCKRLLVEYPELEDAYDQ